MGSQGYFKLHGVYLGIVHGCLKYLIKLIKVPKGLLRCCLDYFGYLGAWVLRGHLWPT
jgi:hypothetical protein